MVTVVVCIQYSAGGRIPKLEMHNFFLCKLIFNIQQHRGYLQIGVGVWIAVRKVDGVVIAWKTKRPRQ